MKEFRKKMKRRAMLAFGLGEGTPKYYDALRKEGLMTKKDERKEELAERRRQEAQGDIRTEMRRRSDGGVEASISMNTRVLTANVINEAIRSLGSRKGDDTRAIAADLQSELNKRGTGLDAEPLAGISQLLADGEQVIVNIGSSDSSESDLR